jgi:hypothetical protein
MTTPKKPEWFELAQSDGGKPRTPVKSGARGVLLALPLMLIGAGVVVPPGEHLQSTRVPDPEQKS